MAASLRTFHIKVGNFFEKTKNGGKFGANIFARLPGMELPELRPLALPKEGRT